MSPSRLFAVVAISILLAVLGGGIQRAWSLGAAAMTASDSAMATLDRRGAIRAAHAAAQASAPFSPYPERGYTRLIEIARAAEGAGDAATAAIAWRSVRSAGLSAPGLLGPSAHLDEASHALAALAAHAPGETAGPLPDDPTPPRYVFLLLTLGTAAVVGGVYWAGFVRTRR